MALKWNLQNVKNFKKVAYRTLTEKDRDYLPNEKQYRLKQKPESIILSTIIVGIREITEDNYEKFYNRLHLIESKNGAFFWKGKKEDYITMSDVKKMIGLKTNASEKTRARFLKDNEINI